MDDIEIDRCRASAIRDFEDDRDREDDDLEFEINKVISYAVDDVTRDDPLCVTDEAARSVRRILQDHQWTARRALHAFLQAIAP